jgi:hypothetical protein
MSSFLRRLGGCQPLQALVRLPARAKIGRTHFGPFVLVPKDFLYQLPEEDALPIESGTAPNTTQHNPTHTHTQSQAEAVSKP